MMFYKGKNMDYLSELRSVSDEEETFLESSYVKAKFKTPCNLKNLMSFNKIILMNDEKNDEVVEGNFYILNKFAMVLFRLKIKLNKPKSLVFLI